MGYFSTVTIHPDLLPEPYKGLTSWQTKDLPPDSKLEYPFNDYYDGAIRGDGTFVRSDAMWNPELTGWISLVAELSGVWICIRLERGLMAELISGDEPPGSEPTAECGWIKIAQ